jgi:hypothetical protein
MSTKNNEYLKPSSLPIKQVRKALFFDFARAKTFIFFLLLWLSALPSMAQYATVQESREQSVKALQSNDLDKFIASFSNPIDINLLNEENSYSKTQAALVMRKFLQENKIKSFKVKQSGKSTGGSEFIIGDVESLNGKKFQVYFLFAMINGKAYLQLIEFE